MWGLGVPHRFDSSCRAVHGEMILLDLSEEHDFKAFSTRSSN